MNYDVIIIGGGPSGSSLGKLLQSEGISTCIIDKAIFPREKLCGGLLTEKAYKQFVEIFNIDLSVAIRNEVQKISLNFKHSRVTEFQTSNKFRLVDRSVFDHLLITDYVQSGGTLFEGEKNYTISFQDNLIALDCGQILKYKYLVGADGVYSRVRKYIDNEYTPDGFCLEAFFDAEATNIGRDLIAIHFGILKEGYGWVFPRSDKIIIGCGGSDKNRRIIVDSFKEYVSSLDVHIPYKIRGMNIPYGRYVQVPRKNNILLIGDAAGLVEPITGEGLFYGGLSAKYAFEYLKGILYQNNIEIDYYEEKISLIHDEIERTKRVKKLLFNQVFAPIGFRITKNRKNFVAIICDCVISTHTMGYLSATTEYAKQKLCR